MDELQTMGERELSAFVTAVKERFGSEEAHLAADDWLSELTARADVPTTTREWRTLTIAAAAQLANRVNSSN